MYKSITYLLSALLGAALWTSVLPAPILAASAPVMIPGDLTVLSDIKISDVEAPRAGEPFDTTATATASNGKRWTVSVFWMDTQEMSEDGLNVTESSDPLIATDGSNWIFKTYMTADESSDSPSVSAAFSVTAADGTAGTYQIYPIQGENEDVSLVQDGKAYMPLLMFYLEDGYTCDGTVTLDKYLSGIFEYTGDVLSIPDPGSGITYITGRIGKGGASVLEIRPKELPLLDPTTIPPAPPTTAS